ncbi:MAG: flippase-like domain-containing protein [Gemmatimonadetes bacterium]|nr:flippase-like domain-containing protein [Gemmatimonadota bacterium]
MESRDDAVVPAAGDASPVAGTSPLTTSFLLAYLLGALLICALVYFGGVWPVLAKTRLLDLLIRVGVIKYHDQNLGFIEGVPDHKYYLTSQTPVDWVLVASAVGVFLLFWAVKAMQFHGVARFHGMKGQLGAHGRAFLYGLGIQRFFPFGLGRVGAAAALHGQGQRWDTALSAVFTSELFVVFEVVAFALIGLFALGWIPWLGQLFWPLIVLAAAWLWLRQDAAGRGLVLRVWWRNATSAARALARSPRDLIRLAALSLLAFALEDIAAYTTANAFGIGVSFSVLLMALVGGYIARLLPLTPGGIGQFEWGFATALWVGGVGFPDAVTLALLDNLIRYVAGTVILGSILLWYGIETNLRTVLERFGGSRPVVA